MRIWFSNQLVPFYSPIIIAPSQWHHNEHDSVSNHQPYDCLLDCLFRRRSKKTSKLRVTGLCVGNSPVTGEFPAQMANNAENVSIWWRHHPFPKWHCSSPITVVFIINHMVGVPVSYVDQAGSLLTQWGRNKMVAILQTAFSNAFDWMIIVDNFD